MQITLKLYATLGEYLPPGQRHNAVDIDVEPECSVADVIERFHLPDKLVHLVLINGVYIAPGARSQRTLRGGDVLAMWPPVAGG
jgi:molybdopterin converting factor small subunit